MASAAEGRRVGLARPRAAILWRPMLASRRSIDRTLADLLDESARNIQRAALLLRDLLNDYPEHAGLARELKVCEQDGDRIAHDIFHRLAVGRRVRAPFDAGEAMRSRRRSTTSSTTPSRRATQLGLYRVEATMEQAVEFSDVLVGAGEQIATALRCLRSGTDLGPHLVEIHRLENEGDRLQRDAVASLFAGGIDPMMIIRWKDIFESLEAAVDACERVAHILEGITLKRR